MIGAQRRILLIDDDAELLTLLTSELDREYDVHTAASGQEGIRSAHGNSPDLIVLDVRMPEMCGIEVCKTLRLDPKTREIPIIMLSGENQTPTRVEVFKEGADDFLAKPFVFEELRVRIQSKLRRSEEMQLKHPYIKCGNITILIAEAIATLDGQRLQLSQMEYRLLKFFCENVKKTLTRKEILETVWQGTFVSSRTIDTHMVALRKKLSSATHEIITTFGVGYSLNEKSPVS